MQARPGEKRTITRRGLLAAGAALAWAGRVRADDLPPIVFVHGDSDLAATWETVVWRFESNGYPREELFAISFTNPQARGDDTKEQPNCSSTEDKLKVLSAFVDAALAKTGAKKAASSRFRGCNTTRNYLRHGGADKAISAVLCGGVSHGVFQWAVALGSEYNGKGPFLTDLNSGDETTPGVKYLTPRSDGYDLYAQPDGAYIGKPGAPTGVTSEGPALKGAENLTLDHVDHRRTALSPRAFPEIYKFVVGAAPSRIAIVKEAQVTLNGAVTGVAGDIVTNKPVEGANVEIYAVDPDTGARKGEALLTKTTGADGVLGAADDRQRDGAGVRRRRAGSTHHPHLPLGVPALVRAARSEARPRQRGQGRGRGNSDDEPAARLFRQPTRRDPDRRQDAGGRPAGRSREMAAAGELFDAGGPRHRL